MTLFMNGNFYNGEFSKLTHNLLFWGIV